MHEVLPPASLAQTPLAGVAATWDTSPSSFLKLTGDTTVFRRSFYFSRRLCCVAAALVLLVASGCAMLFERNKWDLNRLRDDRAVDIDKRLETTQPDVPNPF
jgi:hypothetical protein